MVKKQGPKASKAPSILHFEPGRQRLALYQTDAPDCRHLKVALDEQARTITCTACKKLLDPFWYLCLLKREWTARSYRDNDAKKAHAELQQQRQNSMVHGRLFERPADGAGLRAWAVFERYLGREPFSIYRHGPTWYLAEQDGLQMSEEYVTMLLRTKEREESSG